MEPSVRCAGVALQVQLSRDGINHHISRTVPRVEARQMSGCPALCDSLITFA